MIRHKIECNGKYYDIRAKNYIDFAYKVLEKCEPQNKIVTERVSEWFEEWLVLYKSDKKESTRYSYRCRYYRYIAPYIGNKMLHEVTAYDCQKVVSALSGLGKNTIKKVYLDMRQMFEAAASLGKISISPTLNIVVPTGKQEIRRALTPEEQELTLHTNREYKIGGVFVAMMCSGMRPGETALVQGKHYKDGILHILGEKTELADRYVPIPANYEELFLGSDEEYLFTSYEGLAPTTKYHRARLWNIFKKHMEDELGKPLDAGFVPYSYRHTYATKLQEANIPINLIRELMGHSNLTTTQRYMHNTAYMFATFSEKISAAFV